jgi:contact-dependent growth inhibition (CDI) system CdiI-like immunity protein
MTERKTAPTVSRNDYPKFSEFLRGYLHQDAAEEYDSADEAAEEFLADADSDERTTLQKEVRKFLQWAERQSLAAQNSAFKALGGYWTFDNSAEVTRFLQSLLGNHPKHHADEEDD